MQSAFAHRCGGRLRPAAGITCFVGASGLFAAGGLVAGGLAAGTILLGCALLARWVETVDRRTHATVALGLWLVVLGGSLSVGLGRSAASVAFQGEAELVHAVVGVALAGIVTTVYLAFREYGSSSRVPPSDDILETGPEY
ncbi:hypothetical protein [Halovivax limisalsi]|uniref:hypothetical protein n=1 Tax=Halovivax limisalsi TaxID=1453760 RepID=UPI001FFD9E6A|nr:hypothetical protein [Halovivax limisalsi]